MCVYVCVLSHCSQARVCTLVKSCCLSSHVSRSYAVAHMAPGEDQYNFCGSEACGQICPWLQLRRLQGASYDPSILTPLTVEACEMQSV